MIGGGPAGLTAGMYTSRARLNTLIVAGPTPGGQIALTYRVDNFPGFVEPVTGPELVEKLITHARAYGATLDKREATRVDLSSSPFTVYMGDESVTTRTVIIASGSQTKKLGVPGEEELLGRGVFVCATCDAALYEGLRVVVVGGGDSALQEALDLTKFAAEVYIVHRRDTLSGCLCLQNRTKENPKIKVIYNTEVTSINGAITVESVDLRDRETGQKSSMKTDGVLIAIGWNPNTGLIQGQLELDAEGFLPGDSVKTSVPGVYVCGDVMDTVYRQVVTACGTGCMAALEAERFIMRQE